MFMCISNDNLILNFKIGVVKELHSRQIITQKQMLDRIKILQSEHREHNKKGNEDEKSSSLLPSVN